MTVAQQRYQAFISYSHSADGAFAPALQKGLQQLGRSWRERRAMEVFRDETGLGVDPNLWGAIAAALDDSEWFVLLASPQAATSHWVGQEIQHCITTKGTERILIVLTEGTLRWDAEAGTFSEDSDALHPALRELVTAEPHIIDLSWARKESDLTLDNARFRADVVRIVASIRGEAPRTVAQADVRARRRTRTFLRTALGTLAAATAVAVLASVAAGSSWRVATEERAVAEQEARLALARELAALAQVAEDPRAALALAAEAYTLVPEPELSGALITAVTGVGAALAEVPALLPHDHEPGQIRSSSVPTDGTWGRVSLETDAGSVVLDLSSGRTWRLPGQLHHLTPDGGHAIGVDGTILALGRDGATEAVAHVPSLGTEPSFTADGTMFAYRHDAGGGGAELVVADVAGTNVRTATVPLGSDCAGCHGDASWFAIAPDGSHVAARVAPVSAQTSVRARLTSYAIEQDGLRQVASADLAGTGMVRFDDGSTTIWARDGGAILVLDPVTLGPVGEAMSISRAGPLRFVDDGTAIAPSDGCTTPGVVLAPAMATIAALPAALQFTEGGCTEPSPAGQTPRWLLGGTWVRTSAGVWPTAPDLLLDVACTALGGRVQPADLAPAGVDHTPIGCAPEVDES